MRYTTLTILLNIIITYISAQPIRPLIGGDYPDPTILRDGDNYYMTHSGFEYLPGLTIWHSSDLKSWQPIGSALTEYLGSVWAPDISKFRDTYYIYFTVASNGKYKTYVVTAKNILGPWSKPIDVGTDKVIDPCHVIDDETGERWLYLSGGQRIKLSSDGLSTKGKIEQVYDGWSVPKDWIIESTAFEGPKIKRIGEYYYLLNAVGGTAGPPTSHSVIVARSHSINGPWENNPNNPLIHTWNNNEQWWSKGHGSLIDDKEGNWWIVYHAYERHYLNLGRQTIMEPIKINIDGWPYALSSDRHQTSNLIRTKSLRTFDIGKTWKFYQEYDSTRFNIKNNTLLLKGKGNLLKNTSPLLFVAGEHAYEFSVRIRINGTAQAGLTLFYNSDYNVGYTLSKTSCEAWKNGKPKHKSGENLHYHWLKIRNENHVVSGYRSTNGKDWELYGNAFEVSGYNHHTLGDFLSLLPGLFVIGEGSAEFSDFTFSIIQ